MYVPYDSLRERFLLFFLSPVAAALATLAAFLAGVLAMVDGGEVRWGQAWEVVARAADGAPDVATLVARTLASHRPPGAEVPVALMELAPVLRAAGLLG